MTYDYFALNFASVSGFIFLLIFLHANASLDAKIKKTFYLLISIEFVEMLTYSLELWTTTFATLSPLRLWLSAIGYSVRPFIFCLMLILAMRNTPRQQFPKVLYLPSIINVFAAFSVFFTDIVYSYTPDNVFHRGPLGFTTYIVVILYLIILMIIVSRTHTGRSKLEILIIFAISFLLFFAMAIEAAFAVRTAGRTAIIMVTIFYYMFFQTQVHNATMTKEQELRQQLEHDNRIDGTTGVLNKKAFSAAAEKLLLAESAELTSIGFVFLDMDHLKEINDTLGHAIGDTAITNTAETLQDICRKQDLIGRFGGDEFYILFPNISLQNLQMCLNEMQARLQKVYTANGITIAVTASIGAVYTEKLLTSNYAQMVQMADEALYEAKASGRNCHIIKEL